RFGPGRGDRIVTNVADFLPALHAARVPFAVVNALLAVACAGLAGRLFGLGPGLIGGVLLALEPYWCAMAPLVAMDALLSGFTTASLLSGILAFRGAPSGSAGQGVSRPALVRAG